MAPRHKRVRSVVSRIATTAVLGFGLVVACAVSAHLLAMETEQRTAHEAHLNTALRVGTAAAEMWSNGPHDDIVREDFLRWSWAAITDPAVVGTALLSSEGDLLALQPDDIVDPLELSRTTLARDTRASLETSLGKARRVSAEIASGRRLVLLGAPPPSRLPVNVSGWTFGLIVVVAAVGGWCWLRLDLERRIAEPLRTLRAPKRGDESRHAQRLPIDRNDEFGHLARHFQGLIEDHDQSRTRMGQMKRTLDARVAAQTRQIQGMLRRAERRAWIDPLTKLGNRRLLDDRLEELFTTQKRRGEDMSVVLFDLDNFKSLNDTLGHAVGDELLTFVGELLRGSLRSSDIGLRLGGDEFLTILLGTGMDEAAETADRLVKLFRQKASLYKSAMPVMISCGVASIRHPDVSSGESLLALADKALYFAKEQGKGRVGIFPASTPKLLNPAG